MKLPRVRAQWDREGTLILTGFPPPGFELKGMGNPMWVRYYPEAQAEWHESEWGRWLAFQPVPEGH